MKKLFVILALVSGYVFAQNLNETNDGVNHKIFKAYTKSSYTQATANDTTGWITIKGARSVNIKSTATDTVNIVLRFQFKDSFTGYTTGWTVTGDSVTLVGTSSALAKDRVHAFATSDTSITGYDLIRLYNDYVVYKGLDYTGGTVTHYVEIFKP